ncbi:MAG: hypothetical protein ACRDQU_15525 [Pseudonocardiaceae bacterium]
MSWRPPRAWEHLIAHAQAQQLRALARFASCRAGTDLDEFGTDELVPVLHLSRSAADARLHLATRLSAPLPDTLTALQSGAIDLPKAHTISDATEVLDGPATTAGQTRVLTKAPPQTVGELRAALSRAVLARRSRRRRAPAPRGPPRPPRANYTPTPTAWARCGRCSEPTTPPMPPRSPARHPEPKST